MKTLAGKCLNISRVLKQSTLILGLICFVSAFRRYSNMDTGKVSNLYSYLAGKHFEADLDQLTT